MWMWEMQESRWQTKGHVQSFMFFLAMAYSQLLALEIAFHQNLYNFKTWINTI